MSIRVTLYTTANCQYCLQMKRYFQQANQAVFEIPIDDNPAAIHQVHNLAGYLIVPLAVVSQAGRTDMVVKGYDRSRLDAALKQANSINHQENK